MVNVQILQNVAGGSGVNYPAGSIVSVSPSGAADAIARNAAIPVGPSPSGSLYTLYSNAGYIPLTPDPSGYIGPSGHISGPSVGQTGFYQSTSPFGTPLFTVVFPGPREAVFDVLKLRLPLW
jgi:hypothetical protein